MTTMTYEIRIKIELTDIGTTGGKLGNKVRKLLGDGNLFKLYPTENQQLKSIVVKRLTSVRA